MSHYCNFGDARIDIRKQEEGPDVRTVATSTDVDIEIAVTNIGNVDLNNVSVTDDQFPGCARDIGSLGVGERRSYSCTASNVTADITNEACVSAVSIEGIAVNDCDPSSVETVFVDTDNDSLSDTDETNIYNTNPDDADTDNDGLKDGYEVAEGLDPLDDSDCPDYICGSSLRGWRLRLYMQPTK